MAESDATTVSVTVAGSATGVAGGAALSDSTTRAVSHARGIGGGCRRRRDLRPSAKEGDEDGVPGEIRVYATSAADVTSDSVNVSVTGGWRGGGGGPGPRRGPRP